MQQPARPAAAPLNVVLVEPEIASNTGSIGRTCVAAGTTLWLVDPGGASKSLPGPATSGAISLASGRVGDLLVAVESRDETPVALWCASGGRWLRACPLVDVAQVTTLQRLVRARRLAA